VGNRVPGLTESSAHAADGSGAPVPPDACPQPRPSVLVSSVGCGRVMEGAEAAGAVLGGASGGDGFAVSVEAVELGTDRGGVEAKHASVADDSLPLLGIGSAADWVGDKAADAASQQRVDAPNQTRGRRCGRQVARSGSAD